MGDCGDAEEYRLSERRLAILRVLENADEPLGPKEIAEMTDAKDGATRELLSQMAKDGQVKNLGRGQYITLTTYRKWLTILTS